MADIKVGYQCQKCGFKNMEVVVRERHQNEDIKHFMDFAIIACAQNHRLLSPYCSAREFDLMIPITQNGFGFIGEELTEEDKASLRKQMEEKKNG